MLDANAYGNWIINCTRKGTGNIGIVADTQVADHEWMDIASCPHTDTVVTTAYTLWCKSMIIIVNFKV